MLILIVDDEPHSASALALLLQAHGHVSHVAHAGQEACDCADDLRPGVILLDLSLPELSGYDVCRYIRSRAWTPRPFIVALTGWGEPSDRLRTQEAGFDLHLVKPIDPEALLRVLNQRLTP
jgi:DNA-binding response OmpR family regulator